MYSLTYWDRKYGHNEGMNLVLQPVLYKIIAKHKILEIFMLKN
jgi:2-oxoglutarate dehydrogenase complex dehydrogenase (E1) component-like enzyme